MKKAILIIAVLFLLSPSAFALTDEEYNALDIDTQILYDEAHADGYSTGYKEGYDEDYNDGYWRAEDRNIDLADDAYNDGYNDGYWEAYDELTDEEESDDNSESLFHVILDWVYTILVFAPWVIGIGYLLWTFVISSIIEKFRKK